MRNKPWFFIVVACAAVLAGSGPALAQQDQDYAPPETLAPDTVRVGGARALYPFLYAAGEAFHALYPDVDVQSSFEDDADALARLCTDAGALRLEVAALAGPLTDELRDRCAAGVVALELGYAVTAVVANTANEAVDCLTLEELARAWSPEAEGAITDWRQVREALPARTLTAYGPEADLPTFDFFTARVVGEAGAVRLDYVAGPAPQLVRSLAQDPGALAFVDLNTYLENRSALRLLAVDDGAGCVLPEPASDGPFAAFEEAEVGAYALAHPLILVARADALQREAVLAYTWTLLQSAQRGDDALAPLGMMFPDAQTWRRNYDRLFEAAGLDVSRSGVGD